MIPTNKIWLRLFAYVHFIAWALVIVNAVFRSLSRYAVEGSIATGLLLFALISGSVLFFFFLEKQHWLKRYLWIYPILISSILLTILLRSMFVGIILIVLFYPFLQGKKEYEQDGIILATPFQGIMGSCCSYEVKQRKWIIFEKDIGVIESHEGTIDFSSIAIESSSNFLKITYTNRFGEGKINQVTFER